RVVASTAGEMAASTGAFICVASFVIPRPPCIARACDRPRVSLASIARGPALRAVRFGARSFDRRDGSDALAQQELLDLAGRRLRKLAEHDALRNLEARKMPAAVIDQRLRVEHRARLQLDERTWRLAPPGIGLRDDGG